VAVSEETPPGERTEEPTPRRLEQARRRGQVASSRDLTTAMGYAAAFVVLAIAAPTAVARLSIYFAHALAAAGRGGGTMPALGLAVDQAGALLAWPLAATTAVALLAGALQAGGVLSLAPLRIDPQRVLPSWRRVVNPSAFVEVSKGLVKVLVVGALVWLTVRQFLRPLAVLPGARVAAVLALLGRTAQTLGGRLALAAVAVGLADHAWRRHQHRRALRMTRAEVRREHRETEGDPRHKVERQRLHRELAEQRMLADIRKADFVVVNPDHLAIALQYDRHGDAAPVVVARGERLLAEKIKEVAREAGIPIFRDINLAQALRGLEEGDEIPEALYEAVAEILRVVDGLVPVTASRAAPGSTTAPPDGAEASVPSDGPSATRVPPESTWRRA
jgi:flagellar biosynthesis protein FlhB